MHLQKYLSFGTKVCPLLVQTNINDVILTCQKCSVQPQVQLNFNIRDKYSQCNNTASCQHTHQCISQRAVRAPCSFPKNPPFIRLKVNTAIIETAAEASWPRHQHIHPQPLKRLIEGKKAPAPPTVYSLLCSYFLPWIFFHRVRKCKAASPTERQTFWLLMCIKLSSSLIL